MDRCRRALLVLAASLSMTPPARSQEFEVAAVKQHAPGTPCGDSNTYPGGRLILNCFTLYEIVRDALDLQPGQSDELSGGPSWVRTDLWDITAKAAGGDGELPTATYRAMLFALAKHQFQLKVQSRKREIRDFKLVVDRKAKPRPGLHANTGAPHWFDLKPGISLTVQRVSMKEFAAWLKMPMAIGRHVEDMTGLEGEYDFVLNWSPPLRDQAADAPTIFTALREQLGLRLKSGRGRGDVYVIEAAERPRD
jgi:uncharacterized protein (TIGR03435 family)